ncbi:MAG: hypothetical protein QUS14_10010 [Pyrinomonadaceae bacterium]|nr:hypothetical protein [Pyrinomonadaceae bacterium]
MKRTILLSLFVMLAAAGSVWAQQSSVAGGWEGTFNTPGGARPFKVVFNVEGEKLTGTVKRQNGDVPLTGTIKGDDISFSYTISYGDNALTLFFTGKVSGDTMGGNVSFGGNADDSWSAKRVSK